MSKLDVSPVKVRRLSRRASFRKTPRYVPFETEKRSSLDVVRAFALPRPPDTASSCTRAVFVFFPPRGVCRLERAWPKGRRIPCVNENERATSRQRSPSRDRLSTGSHPRSFFGAVPGKNGAEVAA